MDEHTTDDVPAYGRLVIHHAYNEGKIAVTEGRSILPGCACMSGW